MKKLTGLLMLMLLLAVCGGTDDAVVETAGGETADDATLADIITVNGGDVDTMHALLLDILADSEIADTQDDMDAFVTEALNR